MAGAIVAEPVKTNVGLPPNEQETIIPCTLADSRWRLMSFCAPSHVDGQRELAPIAPPGSRSGLCMQVIASESGIERQPAQD
jgi:hypothetical protein